MSAPHQILLTRRDAARALAVCDRTLDAMIRKGEIPVVRIGRSVRIDIEDIRRFVARAKQNLTKAA